MRSDRRQFAPGVQGFTLIELLTVIAIIALLAAILLPVFARARESARQATCMSNLKDIYQAVEMYRMDNGEYPTMLLGPAMNTSGLPWQAGDTAAPVGQTNAGFLYPKYIKDISKFHCPDDPSNDQTKVVSAIYPGPPGPYAGQTPVFNTQSANKLGFPFPKLPAGYNGKPISYYGFDSYDLTPLVSSATTFQVTYNRDWTNAVGRQDTPYQLKYPDPQKDKTVVTYCNYHAAVNGADKTIVLLLSGTAKAYDAKKVAQTGWTFGFTP